MLPLIFHAVAAVTAMVGEGVARTFVRFRPLEAYRLDILGSSGGIAAFSALSFFDAKLIPFAALASLAGLLTAQSLTSRAGHPLPAVHSDAAQPAEQRAGRRRGHRQRRRGSAPHGREARRRSRPSWPSVRR